MKICTPLIHHENNNSTFTVPLKVTLSYAFNDDDTVEVPDDATGFAVMTHVHDSTGIEAGQIRIVSSQASQVLKHDTPLSARYLKLKIGS
jgi:hypothetical protein